MAENNIIDMQGNEKNETELIEQNITVRSQKVDKLTKDLEDTNAKLDELTSDQKKMRDEDLIVQEKEWLKKRTEEQRLAEEREREEIFEKQKKLEEMRRSQTGFSVQSRQMKTYNQMHEEEQRDQVYALHGVSVDKFEGMKEYKNALYQGAQIMLLLIDLVLCVAAAYLYGYSSSVFVLFIALFASRISLLPREHHGALNKTFYCVLAQIFSFLPTLIMIAVIVDKETAFLDFDLAILIAAISCVFFSIFGALDYFVRNPYREYRRACREAKADLKSLKRDAAKTVKKNIRLRQKLENELLKRKNKQESKLLREQQREEFRFERAKKREEQQAEKNRIALERQKEREEHQARIEEMHRENNAKRRELWDKKIVNIKAKMSAFSKRDMTGTNIENELKDGADMVENTAAGDSDDQKVV